MRRLPLLVAVLAFALQGCATLPRYEAASDIHAFLVSIRDTDQAAFDRHVDRPALKAQLFSRLIGAVGASSGPLGAFGAMLSKPVVGLGVDTLVRPEVFRAIAVDHGYAPDKPLPGLIAIGQFVRPLDSGRACVFTRRDGPCVLMFKSEDGVFKLIGFEGRISLGKGGKLELSE